MTVSKITKSTADVNLAWGALHQGQALTIVVEHVLYVNGGWRDVQNSIAAIDDVALGGNEDIFSLRKEDLLRFSRPVGKAKKLERDGRRRRRQRRRLDALWRVGGA